MGGRKSTKASKCPKSSGDKHYPCKICSKTFRFENNYVTHLAIHDANRSRLICPHCPDTFMSKFGLNYHIKTKHVISKEAKHDCIFCGAKFVSNFYLEVHIRRHINELPYFCRICRKEFATSGDYNRHQRTHLPDRPRPFRCSICPSSFYEKDKLQRHITNHLCEKPHKCGICGTCFKDPTVFKYHLATHSGKKTVPCDNCPMMFTTKHGMKNHRRTVHRNPATVKM